MTRMKDSGIEWIGEVPEEWGIKPIKHIFGAIGSGTTPDSSKVEYYDGNINWLQSGDLYKKDYVYAVSKTITDLGYRSSASLRIYQAPFLAIAMYGASIGNLAISKIDACVNQAVAVLKGEENIVRFAKLALEISKTELIFAAQGGTQPNINQVLIKNWVIPFPSEIEIKKIADFLDKKVAQLDKIKSLLEEQIKTLEDYRKSLIYETVTIGLDKTVPLKDSGVDWIGQIPEGWGITKFKYFLDTNKGLTITKENLIEDGIPVINYGQIHSKYGKSVNTDRDELPQVSANYLKFKQSLLKPGDFVFADTSEDIDGSGNFSTRIDDNGELFAGYHTIKAKLKNALEHDFRYFMHYFDSLAFRKQVQNKVSGIKVYSITQSILQETCLILPSLYEQQQIATFLDKKTKQINQMIAIKKEQIENINKQRQTLIYDYVTGKRRV